MARLIRQETGRPATAGAGAGLTRRLQRSGQAHFNQTVPRRGRRGWTIFYRLRFAI